MNAVKLPELLAPAGSPACAIAAFDSGADAVYAGLARFNARERGENFTPDSLGKVIDHAHKLGKKVYVTFNTLLKEDELPDAAQQLALLDDLGPDALLVQDLGLMRMARKYFPRLALHASTQMAIHNSAGIAVAERLGAKRVVLERQVTLDELAEIRRATKLEIEVFVHGALCASLSGCCFFSSYLGGCSGNRGKCKQPCRRRYFSKNGNGFFFSPQDLCTLDLLPELVKLGVASLKIEGRLRQPDYVAATVEAYRMVLDAPATEFETTLKAARNRLSSGCGRRWSHGFYSAESAKQLIQSDALGAAGLRCGTVENIFDNGFGFTTAKRLFLGDRLRIQPRNGDEGPAFTLTKFFVADRSVHRALPGETVAICCDKPIPEHGIVFKIGESFPDYSKRLAALPSRRARLDLEVKLAADRIDVKVLNAPAGDFSAPLALSAAAKHPASLTQLEKEFSAADSDVFTLGKFNFAADGDYFFPAPELKHVRREFWDFIKANLAPEAVVTSSAEGLEKFRSAYLALRPAAPPAGEHLRETVALKPHGAEPGNRNARRADSIWDFNKETGEAILPEFCPEGKLASLKKAIAAAHAAGVKCFRATSLYALELLRGIDGISIATSFPLPVCNAMAAAELADLGVSRAMCHIELDRKSIEALQKHSPLPLELYRWGRPALLTSRATLPVEDDVTDNRGNAFVVRFDHRDGLTRIYPRKVVSVPRIQGLYDYYDLTNANWKSLETTDFNFSADWL